MVCVCVVSEITRNKTNSVLGVVCWCGQKHATRPEAPQLRGYTHHSCGVIPLSFFFLFFFFT